MPEIDEFEKQSKEMLEKLGYSVFTIEDKAVVAQTLREVHDRGYRKGLAEDRDPKY